MQENEFIHTFQKVLREHPSVFSALEEYDLTRKPRKISYKVRANFTIDSDLIRKFRAYCSANGHNMSKILEKHIQEELKNATPR